MARKPFDLADAKLDPTGHFGHPREVLDKDGLTREDRIDILKQWEREAHQLQVAAGENMAGGEADMLRDVRLALRRFEDDAT
ncbi:MAG: hypothetical protein LPL00_00885 [Alphaproteobacteria bacterium]|nr:hypothetical protein [Alphaproteobacteria bacterium]MDX5367938.1 hypothetical protein [Alphaproteobacteria bacterium]MDX5462791.1 hypothetical protein [Alphaproteobacteria bacterium]